TPRSYWRTTRSPATPHSPTAAASAPSSSMSTPRTVRRAQPGQHPSRPVGGAGRDGSCQECLLVDPDVVHVHLGRLGGVTVGGVIELDGQVHLVGRERAGVGALEPLPAVDVAGDPPVHPLDRVVVPLGEVERLLGALLLVRRAVVQEEADVRRRAGGLAEVHLAAVGPLPFGPQQEHGVVLLVALGEAGADLPLAEPLVAAPGHTAGGALAVAADRHDPVLDGDRGGVAAALAAVALPVVGAPPA